MLKLLILTLCALASMAPKQRLLEPVQLHGLAAMAEQEKAEVIQRAIGRGSVHVACRWFGFNNICM